MNKTEYNTVRIEKENHEFVKFLALLHRKDLVVFYNEEIAKLKTYYEKEYQDYLTIHRKT